MAYIIHTSSKFSIFETLGVYKITNTCPTRVSIEYLYFFFKCQYSQMQNICAKTKTKMNIGSPMTANIQISSMGLSWFCYFQTIQQVSKLSAAVCFLHISKRSSTPNSFLHLFPNV